MLVAILGLAFAAPVEPPSPGIAAGEDVGAWQDLVASRPEGDAEIASLEAFLVAWPDSALAEVAWTRLRDLGALDEVVARHPELDPWLPFIERSRAQHEEELARTPVATTIVALDADGEPIAVATTRWTVALSLGGGWAGDAPWGGLGFRVEHGWVGVVGRAGYSDVGWGQAGLRAYVPSTFGVGRDPRPLVGFAEITAATDGRFGLGMGGRLLLARRWWLEATGGATLRGSRVGPAVGVEILVAP